MISIDKLKNITHLVTHANCPDGIASALIVRDALPSVKVSFVSHGTAEFASLVAEPGMLFVDFVPPRDRVQEFISAGAVVLDHHPTAKGIVEAFGENGVFGLNEKNECGAWLSYEQVWKPICFRDPQSLPVELFARRAAIRDTWKKDDPLWQDACAQAEVLLFWGFENVTLGSLLETGPRHHQVGERLVSKQLAAAQRSLNEGHRFFTDRGTQVCLFQGVSTTSDAAELEEKNAEALTREVDVSFKNITERQADLLVGFHYKVDADKLQLQFSMRSHTGYDCAAFAKAHGGGGHTAAAGFTIEVADGPGPYLTFKTLLEQWEGR